MVVRLKSYNNNEKIKINHNHLSDLVEEKREQRTKLANVLLYGIEKSGKTTLINSFLDGTFTNGMPSTAHEVFEVIFGRDMIFDILEAGGRREIQQFALRLLDAIDAIIFVIDGNNEQKFREVKTLFEKIVRHPSSQRKPLAILFHKIDLATVHPSIIVEQLEIVNLIDRPHQVFLTTAKDPQSFKQVLYWIRDRLAEKNRLPNSKSVLIAINILDMLYCAPKPLPTLSILGQLKLMTCTGYGDYDRDNIMAILRKLTYSGNIEYIKALEAYKITEKGRKKFAE